MSLFVLIVSLWFLAFVALIFTLIAVAYRLAKDDIFFTFVPEGKLKTVMVGEKASRFLGRINGYYVDPDTGDIPEISEMSPEQKKKDRPNVLLEKFGVTYIGLWPFATIDKFKFKWDEWDKESGDIIPRKDLTDHLRFRFPYAIKIKNAETKDKVPVTVILLVTFRIRNADRARFKSGGEWLTNSSGAVVATTREWIGNHNPDDLTSTQHETTKNGFIADIMSLNNSEAGNKSLNERFGAVIDAVNFLSYEIEGPGSERLRIASTEAYVASETAKGTLEKAEAEAKATVRKAKGEAEAIEITANAKATARRLEGTSNAEALTAELAAIGTHRDGADIVIGKANADAVRENKVATTWVFGQGSTMLSVGGDKKDRR